MQKKENKYISPTSNDEPSIGFAKPIGPPVWWYSALAVVIILFLLIILLSFVRFWIRGKTNNSIGTQISATPKPTNAPYSPDTFLSPLPYEDFTIKYLKDGSVTSETMRSLKLHDVILIYNQDSKEHTLYIQDKEHVVTPNEVYAHKISSKELLTIKLENTKEKSKIFTFVIQ